MEEKAARPAVMIDAGSSGCKVFASGKIASGQFATFNTKFNIGLASCAEAPKKPMKFLANNAKALCNKPGQCRKGATLECEEGPAEPCACYRQALLQSILSWLKAKLFVIKGDIQIKILATAGMRLVSAAEDSAVWTSI